MVLGLLKPILNPIFAPAAPASPVAKAAAASQETDQQAAETPSVAASQPQGTAAAQTEGVKFDLSDKALQLVEAAAASQSAAPQAPAAQSSVAAAASAPASAPASASASRPAAASAPASTEPVADVSETAADQPAKATDPSEEDRARAWAIRAVEREKLLNLADILKVTPKADPAQQEVAEHAAAQPGVRVAPASQRGAA